MFLHSLETNVSIAICQISEMLESIFYHKIVSLAVSHVASKFCQLLYYFVIFSMLLPKFQLKI